MGKLTNHFLIELTEYDNFKDRIDNLLVTNKMQLLHINRHSF